VFFWAAAVVAAGSVSADTTPESSPDVLVSGNKSVVRYDADNPFWYPWPHRQSICTSFYVSSRTRAAHQLVITSSGLGAATFKEEPSSTGYQCPNSNAAEQSHLVLPSLEGTTRILMRLPASDLPEAGNSIEGKIIVATNNQKPLEIPIKFENPSSHFRTAWLWVWGILLPGGITFGFGYLAAVANGWLATRRTERQTFEKYRDANYVKLDRFFTGPYTVSQEKSQKDDLEFARAIRAALVKEQLLAEMPRYSRRKLEKQIRLHNREKIKSLLAKLFPDWRDKINEPANQQQPAADDNP
jgi:hypothetical protein